MQVVANAACSVVAWWIFLYMSSHLSLTHRSTRVPHHNVFKMLFLFIVRMHTKRTQTCYSTEYGGIYNFFWSSHPMTPDRPMRLRKKKRYLFMSKWNGKKLNEHTSWSKSSRRMNRKKKSFLRILGQRERKRGRERSHGNFRWVQSVLFLRSSHSYAPRQLECLVKWIM